MASRILLIEDDEDIRLLAAELLSGAGHEVEKAADARAGLRALHARAPALVILDVGLPDLDGWQALERIRDISDVPVLMLTAHDAELEKVRALQAGADDYVTKPFGRQELLARVEALIRRAGRVEPPADRYDDGRLQIDYAGRTVTFDDRDVKLTPLEFRLLSVFVRHPRQVLANDQLAELVWGDTLPGSNDRVKLYVGYLRRKLGADPSPVETVRGFGYRFSPAS